MELKMHKQGNQKEKEKEKEQEEEEEEEEVADQFLNTTFVLA